jgi:fatty-acyl-CoA synthase
VAGQIPLTPVSFLQRAAAVFGERVAVVDGCKSFTYREFAQRVHALGGLLAGYGVAGGDRVAALCANSHVMLELHNGVPAAGAALVPLNFRLSPGEMEYVLCHSGARLLVCTSEHTEVARELAARVEVPLLVADDGGDYEAGLASASTVSAMRLDENQLLAVNYTSGSTGRPKGVMYSHRGAYLQALAVAYHNALGVDSRYLWTLPMFHCNGWCFTWAVTAAAGTHVCLRKIEPGRVWQDICERGITHLSGAPTVLMMIAEAAERLGGQPAAWVHVTTGGAPPAPSLLARLSELRLRVTHLYGLTETYGPCVVNQWQPEWSVLPAPEQARLNARQGVGNIVTAAVDVVNEHGEPAPADGSTLGEIVISGNNVMLGYFGDPEGSEVALAGGVLHTGDVGVRHPDGYVELRDRAKDVIISGGENIASVEIEQVLAAHPQVLEVAVVGRADNRWGEVPVAFVTTRTPLDRAGEEALEPELIEFVQARLARFKAPKAVVFADLPKTSTGKVQKHLLRAQLSAAAGRPGR